MNNARIGCVVSDPGLPLRMVAVVKKEGVVHAFEMVRSLVQEAVNESLRNESCEVAKKNRLN